MLNADQKFLLLHENLKELYKEQLEMGIKIAGVLLAVLGWFIASKNPLDMLCLDHSRLPTVARACVVLGQVALAFLFYQIYARSARVYKALQQTEPDESLYRSYRITRLMLTGAIFGHFTMMFGIFFAIHYRYVEKFFETCGPVNV